jgi:hypothetical protein
MNLKKYESGLIDKPFLGFFSIFMVYHLFWIYFLPIFPFVDLPFHLASSTVSRYYGQGNNEFQNYFYSNLFLKPNGIHYLFTSLNIFPTVEVANKIFYGIYVILFPLSVLLVSLYFFHLFAAFFSLMLFVSCCLYRYRYSFRLLISKLHPAGPLILLLGWWLITAPKGNKSLSDLLVIFFTQYPKNWRGRLAFFVWDNYFFYEGMTGYWVAAGLGIVGLSGKRKFYR